MLTDFGKELRKMRIDKGERILDMANKLGVTPAFISNIEHGRKEPPSSFDTKLITAYGLTEKEAKKILDEYALARSNFTIQAASNLQKQTVAMFARKLPKVSSERLLELQKLMTQNENDGGRNEI